MLRVLAVLSVLASVPTALSAQIEPLDPFQRSVHSQLRRFAEELDVQDMTHSIYLSQLNDAASETVTVELEGGVNYVILGVCDNDCSDLDLELFQGTTAVSEDLAADDFPVVTVEPTTTRTYRLKITMADCSAAPCRFGVAVYERE